MEARLENLENAIDAIEVEMEWLGEGQRITSPLLTERAAVPAIVVEGSRGESE